MKFLLRPGWIGAILLVTVFSTLCFTLLAPWQFGRNEQAQNRNEAIQESFHAAPRPLTEVLPGNRPPDESTEWSKVTFRGRYLPEGETLAWMRTVQGEPAIEVLTPFRLDNGTTVLVDRGYLRPVNGTEAPDYAAPPPGTVELTARVHTDEVDSKNRPTFQRHGHRWTYAINAGTVSDGTGIPMRSGYFALRAGEPGVLSPLPLPQLESGPHFSYALQWITFGIMAPLAVGYLIYSELRPSRGPAKGSRRPHGASTGRRSRTMSVAEAIAEDERREREEATRTSGDNQRHSTPE